ncbi:hypothetical protein DL96DRAFT_1458304 [Flagelloscypha sp. PMI_526]|nr:hypothetical protein DL96DRAFT_1458304 [Flagelloscypha sp. PMI_526]
MKGVTKKCPSEAGDTGLSTLLILYELMERIAENLENDVGTRFSFHPHEVFDLIAGSGTGGIAALLLGRLGRSVSEAIEVYVNQLAPLLFGSLPASADEKQAATLTLEAKMQNIVKDFGKRDDLRLHEPASQMRSCKTFVLTLMPDNLDGALPVRLRTYKTRNPSPNPPIWQAMRATTSNRNRFLDVKIRGDYVHYFGTDYGNANPIKALLDETRILFRGQKFASVTSIGAGHRSIIAMPNESHSNPSETMFQMARDCERDAYEVAVRFSDEQENEPEEYNPYARLSVEQGMQSVEGLDSGAIEAHTKQYLRHPETIRTIDAIVNRLSKKPR